VSQACCPHCRLIQPPSELCTHCGNDRPRLLDGELDDLLRPQVTGISRIDRPPATGWRDLVAVTATAIGVGGGTLGGILLVHHPVGALAGFAIGWFGYRKQFWKTILVRSPRLLPVDFPSPPAGDVVELSGTAQLFERTVVAPITRVPALAAAVTVEIDRRGPALGTARLVVRAIHAAPFWLVTEGAPPRRVLITGACWVTPPKHRAPDVKRASAEIGAPDLPLPKDSIAEEAAVEVGARVTVTGVLREEQLAAGGYRDSRVETMRGEPGSVVWIGT
jgi:hypothetical protein